MIQELVIITSGESREKDERLASLSDQLGIQTRRVPWEPAQSIPGPLADPDVPFIAGAVSSKTIGRMIRDKSRLKSSDLPFCSRLRHLCVYDFEPSPICEEVLQSLLGDPAASILRFYRGDHRYEIGARHPEVVRELVGRTFEPINEQTDFFFEGPRAQAANGRIMSIDGKPFVVRREWNGLQMFLVASSSVVDIQEKVDPGFRFCNRFSGLLPFIMFLMHVFKDLCWHNNFRGANFIIDDPLLKRRYGFLDYNRLTRLMIQKKFRTTIAFIPWNYKRTTSLNAKYFREHRDLWSLCVHGCDHTAGEFAVSDLGRLGQSVITATERMAQHEKKTGIGFDKIMVFPQGMFSTAALRSLKTNSYLAAVNSSIHPRDEYEIRITDYLEIALSRCGGFPVFQRRYPREIDEVMIDLFLGKPAILVEHHEYFKNEDDDQISGFVDQIRAGCPQVQWTTLGEIVLRSHLFKKIDEDTRACRLYAPQALIENLPDRERMFMISKREADPALVYGVFVNDQHVDYDFAGNYLSFSQLLGPGETVKVMILYDSSGPLGVSPQALTHRIRVLGRRMLSEIRDEVISRHDGLYWAARAVRSIRARKGQQG